MQSSQPIITLDNVELVREHRRILSGVNLNVNKGDFLVITGPNGGGKTSLLRVILKLIQPSKGRVVYNDPGRIGYLPQKNMIDSHFPITVREVVASGLITKQNMSKKETETLTEKTLDTLSLLSHADAPIGKISGGQLQRTLLGRAIINNPDVLVLDEPLSYLDKHFEQVTYEILEKLSKTATILLVSHEITRIAPMATRHLIVDRTIHECSAHHHPYIPECD